MPPCLLAIRSLLGSSRRLNHYFLPFQLPFPFPFTSTAAATAAWRSPAHSRRGIAGGGDGVKDEQISPSRCSSSSPPSSQYTPLKRAKGRLGAYTSTTREPYVSSSDTRVVRLISKGSPTTAYSTHWDPAFAKLQLLHYTDRQDENPATKWRKLVMFGEETRGLAKEVRASLMQRKVAQHEYSQCARERARERDKGGKREREEGSEKETERKQGESSFLLADGLAQQMDMDMDGWTSNPSIWDKLHPNDQQQWFGVMLYLLAYAPESALSFLRATHHTPYPPLHAVQDSLRHLANLFHSHPDPKERKQRLRRLSEVVRKVAHRSTGEALSLPHGTLAHILPAVRPKDQLLLWNAVREYHIDIHWHTDLHFATHLAQADHFDQALDAMSEAHRKGATLTSKPFLSTCSTLLRSAIRQPSGLRVCLRIVDNLVEMGVSLNLILCNIIMLNAVEAHDFTTAWSIYHSLPNYGLKADAYTFAILLKACKVNLDDADMLNETIRNAIAHVNVKNDPILAADILHTLALHHTNRHPEKAFETLADAYSQLFDTTPLSDLGILPVSQILGGEKKMLPSHSAIGVMLTTYLQQLFLQTQSPTQTRALYQRYRALVTSGVEPWCSMVDKDFIPNAFLVTLTKTKAGLLPAAEIIKTMQRIVPEAEFVKIKQCEPTVQTWTIFMHGFQRHGQMKMAEQVLEYMRRKSMEPDQVTWNVLAEGYAILQDVEGVEGVLQRLKEEGLGWDEWTGRSVGKATRGFGIKQSGQGVRELDFTGDLREGLERKIIQGLESTEKEGENGREEKYTPMV